MNFKTNLAQVFILVFLGWLLPGCGKSVPVPADSARAKDALAIALEAWKKGETPESLQKGTPPIYFTYGSWQKGDRLVAYKILEPGASGLSVMVKAQLSLEDKNGERREEEAEYNIDTDPKIVIVPGGF